MLSDTFFKTPFSKLVATKGRGMNYLTHGRDFLDDPYMLAGTAVPDWLSVVDRRVRVRQRNAEPFVDDPDVQIAAVARGVVQHHKDDSWFHQSRAFHELSVQLTIRLRDALPAERGFRPSFLGHILVEILLDATLIADQPNLLEAYYQAVDAVDPEVIQRAVNRMSAHTTDQLARLLGHFSRVRFLSDYAEDAKLLVRLNQVMHRVGIEPLDEAVLDVLPVARRMVRERRDELLARPS